jgi:hypothetical protein
MLGCLKYITAEQCLFEIEITTEKWKRYKLLSINQILVEVIHTGGETLCSEIYKVINCIWKKEQLPHQWKESIIASIYKKGDEVDCSNYQHIVINFMQNFIKHCSLKINSILTLLSITIMDFGVTDKLLIRFSAFVRYWRKNGSTM